LAEAVGHLRRKDSRNEIGAAAGAEADKKLDRPVGIACHLRPDSAGRASTSVKAKAARSDPFVFITVPSPPDMIGFLVARDLF
jgi:hypothetical protein